VKEEGEGVVGGEGWEKNLAKKIVFEKKFCLEKNNFLDKCFSKIHNSKSIGPRMLWFGPSRREFAKVCTL